MEGRVAMLFVKLTLLDKQMVEKVIEEFNVFMRNYILLV